MARMPPRARARRAPPGRRRGAPALALAAFVLAVVSARAVPAIEDPSCGVMGVPMRTGVVVYRLPRGFLRAGTDSVSLGRVPMRRDLDYALDRTRGELRLLRDPLPGDTLWVRACWLLAPPPTELALNRYRASNAAGADTGGAVTAPVSPRPGTAHDPGGAPGGAALVVSGNKSLAVDFGSSQDAFVRQSLDLSVSGALAPGVQLTGVLSDRNVPIGTGGTTQGLQSFDRVLLELTAPRGSAALGDIALEFQRGEFARFERRLQGMRAEGAAGRARGVVAAANARGEYRRMQFAGIEGRQGPYLLTDGGGSAAVSVVPGSDAVTVDGVRMTRGESADYSMDYDRGQLTFSNRRPISSDSRITVDYQFSVTRYRRNLAAAGMSWDGPRLFAYTHWVMETDDRGHPITATLGAADRDSLAAAGDSATFAVGPGVTPGTGDYDSVRVAAGVLAYAFAGQDSGGFAVQFTAASGAAADYADSAVVAGRTVYRYVGPGIGRFRIGRPLPLPEAHRLMAVGGGVHAGALTVEVEGALSQRDPNTLSTLGDDRHAGGAGRATAALEGALPAGLGRGGLTVRGRTVGERFEAFTRLAQPFAQEQWGLPIGGDLEHQRVVEAAAFVEPRSGGRLALSLGHLATPAGFAALRRAAEWTREGRLTTRALWEKAEGTQDGRQFGHGGRDHARLEARVRLRWLEPAVRLEADERRSPSDSLRVGDRFRELGAELGTPAGIAWRGRAGFTVRRNARIAGNLFVDQNDARTLRGSLESPGDRALGFALDLQRRLLTPRADPQRSTSDLASLRVRGNDRRRGLRSSLGLEVTTEGQSRHVRSLIFVGPGKGAYDASGSFVGRGDYDLTIALSPDLERVARAATSARAEWQLGGGSPWRGSRAEFQFEGEARRRGELLGHDALVSPAMALADTALVRASLVQRFEGELAPESRAGGLRVRAERRITSDRSFANFAQILHERRLDVRWRSRPGLKVSGEIEARWTRRDAQQELIGALPYRRTLTDRGGTGRLGWTPGDALRLSAVLEATWSSAGAQSEATRTLRGGPDLSIAVGKRGRLDQSVRRAFVHGPPPSNLLPSLEPAGVARWESQTRVDYRVRESTTFALSVLVQDRPERPTLVTGRAELRAFF